MPDSLQAMIQRLIAGTSTEADIQAIAAAIASGQLILANAPGAVGIGGDASGSQIVTRAWQCDGRSHVLYLPSCRPWMMSDRPARI